MIHNRLYPLVRICQILGLGPVYTGAGFVYQLILIVAFMTISSFAVNDEIKKLYTDNSSGDISSTITEMQHVFSLFVEAAWLYSVLLRRQYYNRMSEYIQIVNRRLATNGIHCMWNNVTRKIYLTGTVPTVLTVGIRIGIYKYVCFNCGIYAQISTTLADVLIAIGVFQLYMYSHVVSSLYQAINKQLEKLANTTNISQKELDRQVYSLASCHQTATNAADEFIGAYVCQLLIFVASVFLKTLFTAYQNTNTLLVASALETQLVSLKVWNVVVLLLLIAVIHSCTSISEHANNSGRLVHAIMRENQNANNVLNMMSLQLLHRPMELVCAGMFPINYTILYNLTITAALYIVVLVQFDEAKEETEGN